MLVKKGGTLRTKNITCGKKSFRQNYPIMKVQTMDTCSNEIAESLFRFIKFFIRPKAAAGAKAHGISEQRDAFSLATRMARLQMGSMVVFMSATLANIFVFIAQDFMDVPTKLLNKQIDLVIVVFSYFTASVF